MSAKTMALDPYDQDDAEEEGPSYLRRNWELLSTYGGVAFLAFGVVVWGWMSLYHRNQLIAQIQKAQGFLYPQGSQLHKPSNAYDILREETEPNIDHWWIDRIPFFHSRYEGKLYYLMGKASYDLAKQAGPSESKRFWRSAVKYLSQVYDLEYDPFEDMAEPGKPETALEKEETAFQEQLGESLLGMGKYEDATRVLKGVVAELRRPEDNEKILDILAMLVSSTKLEKEYKETIEYGNQRLELAKATGLALDEALLDLAETFIIIGEVDKATEQLQEVEEGPTNGWRKQFLLAHIDFQNAARIRRDMPAGGDPRVWESRYEKAIERLTRVLELLEEEKKERDKKDKEKQAVLENQGRAQMLIGDSYLQLGDLDQAEKSYSKIIRESPNEYLSRAAMFRRAEALSPSGKIFADLDEDGDENLTFTEFSRKARNLINAGRQFRRLDKVNDDLLTASEFDHQVLDAFRLAAEVSKVGPDTNPYLTLGELRQIFEDSIRELQTEGKYRVAMELADLYLDFSLPGIADKLYGQSANLLANELTNRGNEEMLDPNFRDKIARPFERLDDDGDGSLDYEEFIGFGHEDLPTIWPENVLQAIFAMLDADDDRKLSLEEYASKTLTLARALYRDAGERYYRSAQQNRIGNEYPDLIWQAGLNDFEGHAYERAAPKLREFLRVHGGRERDFVGNTLLAKSLLAQGMPEDVRQARERLEDVLNRHQNSPDRFEGRIWLAQTYLQQARKLGPVEEESEQAELKKTLQEFAEIVLLLNVEPERARNLLQRKMIFDSRFGSPGELKPSSLDWRRSLFLLGELLYEVGRYDEAIEKLREAIERWPTDEEAFDARYIIADSYLKSTDGLDEERKQATTPRTEEVLRQRMEKRLNKAAELFERAAVDLSDLQLLRMLQPSEEVVMRSAYFNIGECYARLADISGNDLETWDLAIKAFQNAASLYQDRPEALEAYFEIARAYLLTKRHEKAESTLRQAFWVLEQLGDEDFQDPVIREMGWTKELWLNRLNILLNRIDEE